MRPESYKPPDHSRACIECKFLCVRYPGVICTFGENKPMNVKYKPENTVNKYGTCDKWEGEK